MSKRQEQKQASKKHKDAKREEEILVSKGLKEDPRRPGNGQRGRNNITQYDFR